MKYKFFFIPMEWPDGAETQLNDFVASHSVVEVDRQFGCNDRVAGWSVCVSWVTSGVPPEEGASGNKSRESIDYREILSEEDFAVFAELRQLRKELAQQSEKPVYTIFSNQQLADMVTNRVSNEEGLRAISGIGDSRVKRFAKPFLELLANLQPEDS